MAAYSGALLAPRIILFLLDVTAGEAVACGAPATWQLNMASQTEPPEPWEPRESDASPHLSYVADIMSAIALCRPTLTSKIEAVQLDMGMMRQDGDKIRSRVTETEQRTGLMEDTVTEHSSAIRNLQTKMKALEYKADDAENRNRRYNLRIVGLAEGAEGTNPAVFVEQLLHNLLPNAQFSPYFTVERAHRVLPKPNIPGAPPRTFILRLLNFRDRDEVLRAARVQGEVRYQNGKLLIFPDYSIETQKLRKSFDL